MKIGKEEMKLHLHPQKTNSCRLQHVDNDIATENVDNDNATEKDEKDYSN